MKIIGKTGRTIDIDLISYQGITEINCTENDDLLQGICNDGKRLLWKGDDLYTETSGWHRINRIKQIGVNQYRSTCMERTDTTMMLLPLFGSNQTEMCFQDHFMNAFLEHETYGKQEGIIWVLIKTPLNIDIRFTKLIDKLRHSGRCVKEVQLTSFFTLFTMKLDEQYIKDYTMMILSKFSKMSNDAKNAIYTFHGITGQPDHQLKLQLSKSPVYKTYLEKKIGETIHGDAELRSAIDDERETFRMSYITEDIR